MAERGRSAGVAVLPYLVALYTAVGLLYLFVPPIRPGHVYAGASFAAALATMAVYPALWRAPARRVNALLFAVVGFGAAYALGFVVLTGDPAQTVVLVIALIGASCLLFSLRATVVLALLSAAAWLVIARDFEPAARSHWLVNLGTSAVLSVIITWSRLRVLRGLQRERRHALDARRLVSEQARVLKSQARKLAAARDAAVASLQSKDQFLANMSHELRTPLTSIIGGSDLLLDGDLDPQQAEYVRMVRRSGELLAHRIGDVLDFADLGAGRTALVSTPFELCAAVREVVDANQPAARAKGLAIHLAVDGDVPRTARGDGERFRRVLENLLSNAVRFTDRGEISVSAGLIEMRGKRATVHFEVRDTGEGMSDEALDSAFDAFSQADASMTRKRGGLGLGLALSKSMVELMGGEIGARSEPGKGSSFWFTLPLVVAPEVERATTAGARVLIVEDCEINQQVIAAMVASLGYQPEVAASGAEAIERLGTGRFAAVLMDCMMPEMDGYQTTAAIRAGGGGATGVPIIALTANAQRGARERSLDAGMDDHLTKPVEQAVLGSVLRRWIDAPRSGPAGGGAASDSGSGSEQRARDGRGPLDNSVLAKLRAMGGGKGQGLVAGLVDLFVERAPRKAEAMRDALTRGALADASAAAHSLKSSSAMVGAVALADLCREMEQRASSREHGGAELLLGRLDLELSRVVAALRTV